MVGDACDKRLDRRGAEHVLRLPLELRLGDAHGDHGHQSGENVVTLDLHLRVFEIDLELARVVFHRLANLLSDTLQEAVHMHAAARRGDDVHEALQHRVVAVRPTHRDIDIAGSHDLLRMQVAVRVHCLRLLMVRALPAYSPHGGNGLAVGEEVHEIDNATGMAEFLHTPVSRH